MKIIELNETEQADVTRGMAEALRSMQSKIDAFQESQEGEIDEDFRTEFIGEEMGVLMYVLINRLGFAEYSHGGDDPMFEIIYNYVFGHIEYEEVLREVDKSHELLAALHIQTIERSE